MERLFDDLIGNVRTVIIAGIDMVHASVNRFAQHLDSLFGIARRSPDLWACQLHRAVAQTVHRHLCVRESKASAEISLCDHLLAPLFWLNDFAPSDQLSLAGCSSWRRGCDSSPGFVITHLSEIGDQSRPGRIPAQFFARLGAGSLKIG